MTKICIRCFCEKVFSEFYKTPSGRLRSYCKKCFIEKAEKWSGENPEARKKIGQDWRKENLESARAYARDYYAPYFKKKRKEDFAFAVKERVGARIRDILTSGGKSAATEILLGCSIDELCAHLESQFSKRPGMSWETRCFWHIDHIRPCADFPDLSDPEQQKACFHFTNLQPIWAVENLTKHTKYGGSDF